MTNHDLVVHSQDVSVCWWVETGTGRELKYPFGSFRSPQRALPTWTKVECGTSQSRSGTSLNLSNSGNRQKRADRRSADRGARCGCPYIFYFKPSLDALSLRFDVISSTKILSLGAGARAILHLLPVELGRRLVPRGLHRGGYHRGSHRGRLLAHGIIHPRLHLRGGIRAVELRHRLRNHFTLPRAPLAARRGVNNPPPPRGRGARREDRHPSAVLLRIFLDGPRGLGARVRGGGEHARDSGCRVSDGRGRLHV